MTNPLNAASLTDFPFSVGFDLRTGLSGERTSTKRRLAQMKGMFADEAAYDEALAAGNPLLYEFYELALPESPNELLFGTSIVYPGRVGQEYYMTKGHFHTLLDTPEVYYCLSGEGLLLMENPEGRWHAERLAPGRAVYVPPRYAHRSVNTGDAPLATFFVYRADSGHDYGTIESLGFRKLVVERDGCPAIVDNPRWKPADQVKGG